MIRSILAEFRKVTTTRLWIGLAVGGLLLSAIGAAVLFAVAGTPQGRASGLDTLATTDDVAILVYGGAVMSALTLVLGATMATSEYRYGTAAASYLATPNRAQVLTAKMAAALPIGFVLGTAAGLVPLAVAAVGFAVRGDPYPFGPVLVVDAVYVGVQCAYAASLAVAVGAAVRSQLVAILGLLGWLFIAEELTQALLPDVAKWSPFSGAQNAFASPADQLVSKPVGAALMVAYLVSAWYVAWWLDRRRDV
jgi:ABC-2 type transport system permease protein